MFLALFCPETTNFLRHGILEVHGNYIWGSGDRICGKDIYIYKSGLYGKGAREKGSTSVQGGGVITF